MPGFTELGVAPWLVTALRAVAIQEPTRVQQACIPAILAGNDCIGGAQTGSGKTLAFALPMLQTWSQDPFGTFALVLTPTRLNPKYMSLLTFRELALQIAEQIIAVGSSMQVKVATVVGGTDIVTQALALSRRPHFVVATPGRLADIIRTHGDETIGGLSRTRFLVMDEADRLLSPSFGDELADCMKALPPASKRQTLLFTATVTPAIRQLTEGGSKRPLLFELDQATAQMPKGLTESYILVPPRVKEPYVYDLVTLDANAHKAMMIFCNRTRTVETLVRALRLLDVRVTGLHGEMKQQDRLNSLGRFRAGAARILVATDVASRGLDIPEVAMVVNIDIPRDPDDYVHRVGRTARAGKAGQAVTFVGERDVDLVHAIEHRTGSKMEEYTLVNEDRVLENLNRVSSAVREAVINMTDEGFGLQRAVQEKKWGTKTQRAQRAQRTQRTQTKIAKRTT